MFAVDVLLALSTSATVVPLVSYASDAPKQLTHKWTAMNDPVMGGQSTSRVAVENNVLNFTGHCAIVPSLKAPGFITARTGGGFFRAEEKFVDVHSCTGITITAKAASTYAGFRISFGTAKPPGGEPRSGSNHELASLPSCLSLILYSIPRVGRQILCAGLQAARRPALGQYSHKHTHRHL